MFGEMEEALSDGRPWLVGSKFSLADINVIPFAARLDYLTIIDVWIKERPLVAAWWQKAKARRSFLDAIAKLLKEDQISSMASSGSRIKSEIADKHAEIVKARQSALGAAA
jgi:glutathione S-transferase